MVWRALLFYLVTATTALAGDPHLNRWRRLFLENPSPFSGVTDAFYFTPYLKDGKPRSHNKPFNLNRLPTLDDENAKELHDFLDSPEMREISAEMEKKLPPYLDSTMDSALISIQERDALNFQPENEVLLSLEQTARGKATQRITEREADLMAMNETRQIYGQYFDLSRDRDQQRHFNQIKNRKMQLEMPTTVKNAWTQETHQRWMEKTAEQLEYSIEMLRDEASKRGKLIGYEFGNESELFNFARRAEVFREYAEIFALRQLMFRNFFLRWAVTATPFQQNLAKFREDLTSDKSFPRDIFSPQTKKIFRGHIMDNPYFDPSLTALFWKKALVDPSHWTKREQQATGRPAIAPEIAKKMEEQKMHALATQNRNANRSNPSAEDFFESRAANSGQTKNAESKKAELKEAESQKANEPLTTHRENEASLKDSGNPNDDTPYYRRKGEVKEALFLEVGGDKAPPNAQEKKIGRRWFRQPLILESANRMRALNNLIPIPLDKDYQLTHIDVRNSEGRRLREGPDFEVLEDLKTKNSFIRIYGAVDKNGYTFNAGYKKISIRPPVVQLPPLRKDKMLLLNQELRASGLTNLANVLDAYANSGQALTAEGLERQFAHSSLYTTDAPHNLVEPSGAGQFDEFASFVNADGVNCYNCRQSSALFKSYLEKVLPPEPGLNVRLAVGYYSDQGDLVTKADSHRLARVDKPGFSSIKFDPTPTTKEPPRNPMAVSPSKLKGYLQKMEEARLRYMRAAKNINSFARSDPWIRIHKVSDISEQYLRRELSLAEAVEKSQKLTGAAANANTHEEFMANLGEWAAKEKRSITKAVEYARQAEETAVAAPYQNMELVKSMRERLELLSEGKEISSEAMAVYHQVRTPPSCPILFGEL